MNGIVFPEITGSIPQGKRPLRLTHVLALVYCFGGVAGVTYLLSKFVVTPLFEELTYERRLLAEETRDKLVSLNAKLGHIVTKVPPVETKRSNYVERQVQATYKQPSDDPSSAAVPKTPKTQEIVDECDAYVKSLRELLQSVKSMDPNDERLRTQSSITSQADELAKYARSVQFENIPSSIFAVSVSKTNKGSGDETATLAESVIECKQEIRALKSSILSG